MIVFSVVVSPSLHIVRVARIFKCGIGRIQVPIFIEVILDIVSVLDRIFRNTVMPALAC